MLKEKTQVGIVIAGSVIAGLELIAIAVLIILQAFFPAPETETAPPTTEATTTAPTEVTEPPIPTNPYSPEDFVMVDGFMTCTAADYRIGIDVSSHQGDIDWKQVKEAGVEFVIIRLGYRGYGEEGRLARDTKAQENYRAAKEAGLLVGGYFFSQALDEEEAIEEAELVLDIVKDWELDLPVAYDWEFLHFEARSDGMEADAITDCALAFCETLTSGGVQPMLYTGLYVQTLQLEEVIGYPMWLALYTENMSYDYWMDFWQYSCTGKVPGINTDVDLNIWLPKEE